MEALEALKTRKSAALLSEPAPDKSELSDMFAAALRAPDHGCLRPWRFICFQGEQRNSLGEILKEALLVKDADASDAAIEKELNKPLRAPLVIAVIAKVTIETKIPVIEQVISAGAAAQNIMIAAHALGYAGIWRSGAPCFDDHVRARLGAVGEDQIVGFLYIGTAKKVPPLPELNIQDYVFEWHSVS
ncbi:MAG: nitroreductase [Sneathiellales bacterium]|nr:nitroreductase [Sneathiellales bacterium]